MVLVLAVAVAALCLPAGIGAAAAGTAAFVRVNQAGYPVAGPKQGPTCSRAPPTRPLPSGSWTLPAAPS